MAYGVSLMREMSGSGVPPLDPALVRTKWRGASSRKEPRRLFYGCVFGVVIPESPAMAAGREDGALHAGQLATLAAVADAIIPRGGAFPLGAADVGVAGRLSRYVNAFNPATRRQ